MSEFNPAEFEEYAQSMTEIEATFSRLLGNDDEGRPTRLRCLSTLLDDDAAYQLYARQDFAELNRLRELLLFGQP